MRAESLTLDHTTLVPKNAKCWSNENFMYVFPLQLGIEWTITSLKRFLGLFSRSLFVSILVVRFLTLCSNKVLAKFMLFTFSYLALVCNTFGVRSEGFLSVESSKTVLFTYRAPCIWPYSLLLSSSVGALSGHNHGYVATCGHWGFISFKGSVLGSLRLQNPDIFIAGPINFVDQRFCIIIVIASKVSA